MKPTSRNAFERSWSASRGRPRSLVSLLTPMQAKLDAMGQHFELTLAPMRAVDALPVWHACSDPSEAVTLLSERAPLDAGRVDERALGGLKLLERLDIDTGEHLDDRHLLLTDRQLRDVLELIDMERLVMVRLHGIVDARDIAAMDAAHAPGSSALDADLRAVAVLDVVRDSIVTLHVRDAALAHQLVAENFRQYLAALLDRPAGTIDAPQAWQIERLFSVSGELTVRPIESEVFSTFVDIGISTLPNGTSGPAARSLIYDLPSGTWHDEA